MPRTPSSSSWRTCLLIPGCDVKSAAAAPDTLSPLSTTAHRYLSCWRFKVIWTGTNLSLHYIEMTALLGVHPRNPQPRVIREAAVLLRHGGVVAYPTDSSYALGCLVDDVDAVRRIRAIRDIDSRHHLSLVCRDLAHVGRYARMDNAQYRLVRLGTPGPYTFLLRASREVPRRIHHPRRSTIGVRVPGHAVVHALLSSTLILPGDATPLDEPAAIRAALRGRIEAVIAAGPCPAEPTTVID